jgi:hypothetical protein
MKRLHLLILLTLICSGCYLMEQPPLVTLTAPGLPPTPELPPTPTDLPFPWTDENAVMAGICFEAANDAAEQVFTLRNAEAHSQFYDLADSSGLCRLPVARQPFDFSTGRILVGMWSRGSGCDAFHEVTNIARDDAARTFTIRLRLITTGECAYELVQPFWIGLEGMTDYDVRIGAGE